MRSSHHETLCHWLFRRGARRRPALYPSALAQDPAPGLQDLVGARGSSGEQALQERGYKFVKGEKSGSDSYTNWRNARTGQCIIVRTANGRYQSLVTAPAFDCRGGAAESAPAPGPGGSGGRFATVCGVTVEGKHYRYKCTVEGAAPGGRAKPSSVTPTRPSL